MAEQTMTSIRCLILDDSVIYAEQLNQLLGHEPGFELRSSRTGFGEDLRSARKFHPDIILLAGDTPGAASVVERLDNALPEVPIVVVFNDEDQNTANECLLAGARLCMHSLRNGEEVVDTVRRVAARERQRRSQIVERAGATKKVARVIAFHSAKGGVGTTTMAVNAAVALAKRSSKRVVLVDAAMQSSDVGVLLDIDHTANVTDLIAHMKDLDEDLINEIMARHESGVQVLLAPSEVERADMVTPDQFTKIISVLRNSADYILIDTPAVLDAITMAALDTADQIVLISTPEVAALRNTARFMQLAGKLGYPPEKLFLLLNRARSKGAVATEDIKQHLRYEIGMQIRSFGKSMVKAANNGAPLGATSSRYGAAKSFRQLAVVLESQERQSKSRQRARVSSLIKLNRQQNQSKLDAKASAQNVNA